ncbi:hypothetical protein PCE1_000065 [Barthelona sp. PCE]
MSGKVNFNPNRSDFQAYLQEKHDFLTNKQSENASLIENNPNFQNLQERYKEASEEAQEFKKVLSRSSIPMQHDYDLSNSSYSSTFKPPELEKIKTKEDRLNEARKLRTSHFILGEDNIDYSDLSSNQFGKNLDKAERAKSIDPKYFDSNIKFDTDTRDFQTTTNQFNAQVVTASNKGRVKSYDPNLQKSNISFGTWTEFESSNASQFKQHDIKPVDTMKAKQKVIKLRESHLKFDSKDAKESTWNSTTKAQYVPFDVNEAKNEAFDPNLQATTIVFDDDVEMVTSNASYAPLTPEALRMDPNAPNFRKGVPSHMQVLKAQIDKEALKREVEERGMRHR